MFTVLVKMISEFFWVILLFTALVKMISKYFGLYCCLNVLGYIVV